MMPELSMHILDLAQNGISAGASLIQIDVHADTTTDRLVIRIQDDGCGIHPEKLAQVTDPFFTTRTTRQVGLGIPFLKMAAELTGGAFSIDSTVDVGTTVQADFVLSSIDRMPLGDLPDTMMTLIGANPSTDFVLSVLYDEEPFSMDTRVFREILGDVPLSTPQVLTYIRQFILENMQPSVQRL